MKVFAIVAMLAWCLPLNAEACSCSYGTGDLVTDLTTAKADTHHIYLGRIERLGRSFRSSVAKAIGWALGTTPGLSYDDQATLLVLEVFKGPLKAGAHLDIPNGGFGNCTIGFTVGDLVLVYSRDQDPSSVFMCNRTHFVHSTVDSELVWLRGGPLPPVPVAVRKQEVTCKRCDLDSVAAPLPRLFDSLAMAAFTDGGAFWNGGYLDGRGPTTAIVREADGGTHALTEYWSASYEVCRRRVTRHTCQGLFPIGTRAPGDTEFSCVDAGPEEPVCDENESRTAAWSPTWDIASANCDWLNADEPSCLFPASPVPLAAGKMSSPLLECVPRSWALESFTCRVLTAVPRDGGIQ